MEGCYENGCLPKSELLQRLMWFLETVHGTGHVQLKEDLCGRTESLWTIQARKARGEHVYINIYHWLFKVCFIKRCFGCLCMDPSYSLITGSGITEQQPVQTLNRTPPSLFLTTPNTNHPKQRPNLKERSGLYIGALSNSSFYECNSMWMMCDFMFFKQRLYLTLFSWCFCLWSCPVGPVHLDRWCSTSTCSNAF